MNELLDEVLEAHGGADHWQSVSSITAQGRIAGLLPKRFAGNKLATFTFEVQTAKQHTYIHDFPQAGQRAVFDRGDVRIETTDGAVVGTRSDPRSAFFGASGARRNLHWDSLDVAYFAGYASWNYLNAPWFLAREGVKVDRVPQGGVVRRRRDRRRGDSLAQAVTARGGWSLPALSAGGAASLAMDSSER